MTATTTTTPERRAAQRLGAPLLWLPEPDWLARAEPRLAAAQRGCRARRLDLGDLGSVLQTYADGVDLCARRRYRPLYVLAECHGGAVPNGYGWKAEATWARIDSRTGWSFTRSRALQRPHGQSWTYRLTITWHGAFSVPPAQSVVVDGVTPWRQGHASLVWRW